MPALTPIDGMINRTGLSDDTGESAWALPAPRRAETERSATANHRSGLAVKRARVRGWLACWIAGRRSMQILRGFVIAQTSLSSETRYKDTPFHNICCRRSNLATLS